MEDAQPLEDEQVKNQILKETKRTKWQLPPSHITVFYNPSTEVVLAKSKYSSYRQFSSVSNESRICPPVPETTGTNERLRTEMDCQNIESSSVNGEITLEGIVDALSTPKLSRLSIMARAEICPKLRRARLMSTKGVAAKIREQYGYDISNTTFLYAEETLYLLELGKLEVQLGRVTLSAERARASLLHSKSHPYPEESNPFKIKTCSADEYLVYKHLSELGYRVRRRDSEVKISINQSSLSASRERLSPLVTNEDVDMMNVCDGNLDEGCGMDLEEESGLEDTGEKCLVNENLTPQSLSSLSSVESAIDIVFLNQRGTKRKFGELSSDQTHESTTSSAKDMSDDEYADEELESIHNIGDSCMDTTGDNSFFRPTTSTYTVTEADSDVEIFEEPEPGSSCNRGVHIEEIGYGYDGDIEEDTGTQEPRPSTSAACFSSDHPQQAVVYLADSDSDTENLSSFNKIWSKLVPNTTIQIGFPPLAVLPPNIGTRDSIYEFDLKSRESTRSDSDLEYYVDELTLDSSPAEPCSKIKLTGSSHKSWKEWRQCVMMETQGVIKESLLGPSNMFTGITENAMQKLHLWDGNEPKSKRRPNEGWRGFNIPFELYHPSVGFNKNRNRKECSPSYVVAVVRNDDEVPSFSDCDALVNDIPVLIAVVGDESTIMFMNTDGSPIPSLF